MTNLEARLSLGPEALAALVQSARRPLSLADPLHWHGLAEGAAHFARAAFDSGDCATGLAWARSVVAIYEHLAEDVAEPSSFDVSGMNWRARAIVACGVGSDPLCEPRVIIAWVRAALVGSPDGAIARSARYLRALGEGADPSRDEARELRRMKTRLGVLRRIAPVVTLERDLCAWLAARDRLV